MAETKKIPERAELAQQDKWAIEDIYATDELWEADLEKARGYIPKIAAFAGHLGESAQMLLAYAQMEEEIEVLASDLANYAMRRADEDVRVAKYQAMTGRLMSSFVELNAAGSFATPELMAIPDVGPTTAAYLRAWFDNPQSQHQIRLLRDAGVSFDSREQVVDRRFAGKTFVLTGALEHFSRDEASAIIERFGGKTSSSVSKKTSYLLAGENTGSKYQKALTLGTPIITEAEFLDMIQE